MENLSKLHQYDFHDSLVEYIFNDIEKKQVILKIDFCNWKQSWYTEKQRETSLISLIFENVESAIIPDVSLNSDEIITFELLTDKEKACGIKMLIFNDTINELYEIIIKATSVNVLGVTY